MAITGISHITFIVSDIDMTSKIWVEALGAEKVYDSGGKTFSLSREKFFLLGGVWIAIMQGEPGFRSYHHIALQADKSDLLKLRNRLQKLNFEIKPSRPRIAGEGESLYFYDFDNNLIELHTGTLYERLDRYRCGPIEKYS